MADHIPFVYTQKDCEIVKKFFPDSVAVRLSLHTIQVTGSMLPSGLLRWIDPAVDGLHWPKSQQTDEYAKFVSRFPGYDAISSEKFQAKPEKKIVGEFVTSVLDACKDHGPGWISIPQLPLVSNASRNRINRALAEAVREWRVKSRFTGKMILPVVFTHQNQIKGKTERNKYLNQAESCYERAGADGVWAVESSLSDQEGLQPLERRFKAVINLHEELVEKVSSDAVVVGGPYWALNLVLWARRVVKYVAVGAGSAFQYYVPGRRVQKKAKKRIALPPLRRCAIASPGLRAWLNHAISRLAEGDSARIVFSEIAKDLDQISVDGKQQIAQFYKGWFDQLSAVPEEGRALALYQDLSSAFVVGKSLPDLPPQERAARRPYQLAKQLMVNCL